METSQNSAEKMPNYPTTNGEPKTLIYSPPKTEMTQPVEIFQSPDFKQKFMQLAESQIDEAAEICGTCFGAGMEVVPGKGARPCPVCRPSKARERMLEAMPPKIRRFGIPELKTFAPRRDLHPTVEIAKRIFDEQTKILAKIRANPFGNYYLAGINGCGKTTIGYMILLNALKAGRKCVAITLSDLLEEFRVYTVASGEDKLKNRPSILPDDLKQTSQYYSLLIDEVGSPKASEYRGEMFFNVLNAVQNYGHQLIVTSNKKDRDFIEKWNAFDDTHGDSISRRLSENSVAMRCFV